MFILFCSVKNVFELLKMKGVFLKKWGLVIISLGLDKTNTVMLIVFCQYYISMKLCKYIFRQKTHTSYCYPVKHSFFWWWNRNEIRLKSWKRVCINIQEFPGRLRYHLRDESQGWSLDTFLTLTNDLDSGSGDRFRITVCLTRNRNIYQGNHTVFRPASCCIVASPTLINMTHRPYWNHIGC